MTDQPPYRTSTTTPTSAERRRPVTTRFENTHVRSSQPEDQYVVELDDDEDEAPEFLGELSTDAVQSNHDIPPFCTTVHPVSCAAGTLRPGCRVELSDETFLHVVIIYRSNDPLAPTGIYLKGNLMRRNSESNALLPEERNELHYVLKCSGRDQKASLQDHLVTRAIEDVVRQRNIVITNQPISTRNRRIYVDNSRLPYGKAGTRHQLVCRWKMIDEINEGGKKISGGRSVSVSEEECDRGTYLSDLQMLRQFLGKERSRTVHTHDQQILADEEIFNDITKASIPLANARKRLRPHETTGELIDLTNDNSEDVEIKYRKVNETIRRLSSDVEIITQRAFTRISTTRSVKPRTERNITDNFAVSKVVSDNAYSTARFSNRVRRPAPIPTHTYADICAGGGGMTCGAHQTGLRIQLLLDKCDVACETLRWNFPDAKILQKYIHDFCLSKRRFSWEIVDVLHISYPCQPHTLLSRLNRDQGMNPDNIAAMFSVGDILTRCRPRIVTFEQTAHIVSKNNGEFFHRLIEQITSSGYNVRWRICNFAEYGNVQARRRLIIIAAVQGETLPTFPEPTNGLGLGKRRFVTVQDVLDSIRGIQVPDNMRYFKPKAEQPYDARQPLKQCITCSGDFLHPSGRRTFTLFELAALQGFPPTHRFFGNLTEIRRQIGNAVPSTFAKALFQSIIASLSESDARLAAYKPETIVLD